MPKDIEIQNIRPISITIFVIYTEYSSLSMTRNIRFLLKSVINMPEYYEELSRDMNWYGSTIIAFLGLDEVHSKSWWKNMHS